MATNDLIASKCDQLRDLLQAKNAAYGDSALHPVRIFSRADAEAGLRIRIDDKLSRVAHAPGAFGENEILDLIGYLILLLILRDQPTKLSKERMNHED